MHAPGHYGRSGSGWRRRRWLTALVLVVLFGSFGGRAHAQGKIAGTVTDAANGEPLIGVNIVLDGTTQGTSANADGDYVIVNVRPGEYDVVFSYIGFQSKRFTEVRVTTGQTTRLDAELNEEIIEGQEVVVEAERPLVQKDLTASKKTVVAEVKQPDRVAKAGYYPTRYRVDFDRKTGTHNVVLEGLKWRDATLDLARFQGRHVAQIAAKLAA